MASFAATVVSKLASLSPVHSDMTDTDSILSSQGSVASSASTSFGARPCLSDPALSSPAADTLTHHHTTALRRREHLAVLLPKSLWKPDSQAARCDVFLCSRKFGLFERRHHCRKCGGVFCADCSTRETTLLDTATLDFLNPPRGVPITHYASPASPVVLSRVCDDCWDSIHGTAVSRRRRRRADDHDDDSSDASTASSSASTSPRTPHTPLDGASLPHTPLSRSPLRRAHTSPRAVPTLKSPERTASAASELDAYPLRHASAICKASGGGRWEPKPTVQWAGHRVPGTKADYEIEMEKEEAEARRRRLNPIYSDGIFQLRVPREPEPRSFVGPPTLSTF